MPSAAPYHEPSPAALVILASFLALLNGAFAAAQALAHAGVLGPMLVGVLYGTPVGALLHVQWEDAFIALGYVGLLLVVYAGGLGSAPAHLAAALAPAAAIAATGIAAPMALSFVLGPLASFPPAHALAAGAALASTSLGTVLAVLSPAAVGFDLAQTPLGTALFSAAVMDDIVAFILAKVLAVLGGGGGGIGQGVGRALGVTIGLGVVWAAVARFVLRPAHRAFAGACSARRPRAVAGYELPTVGLLFAHTVAFIGLVAAAGYAGTSPLYGAYIAGLGGAYLSADIEDRAACGANGAYNMHAALEEPRSEDKAAVDDSPPSPQPVLPSRLTPRPPSPVTAVTTNTCDPDTARRPGILDAPAPTLRSTFKAYIEPALHRLLEPLFFASIGTAIPFLDLWRGNIIWRGVVYAVLMAIGKALCGVWVLLWARTRARAASHACPPREFPEPREHRASDGVPGWRAAVFIGLAMIARGEIGLLIAQIARHTPEPLLTEPEFLIVIWAVVLCTIVGPVGVGICVKRWGARVLSGTQ